MSSTEAGVQAEAPPMLASVGLSWVMKDGSFRARLRPLIEEYR